MEVSSNWIPLSNSFYDKVELYTGVFSSLSSSSLTVSAQYGGPVLSLDRGTVTILSSSGEQISAWRWNNKKAVAAGWSDKEEVLFVLEEGIVVIYSMFGILQSSFTMGQEAQDVKLLTGRVFPTHSGTGVAVLTSTHRFYIVASTSEPRVRKLYDCGQLPSSTCWAPFVQDRQCRLLVGRGRDLLLLSHNDMSVLEVQPDPKPGSQSVITLVVTSPDQDKVAIALDSGLLWLGSILAPTRRLASIQLDKVPSSMAWCGEDAVLATLDDGTAILAHISGATETMFQPAPICLVQECDGVRILSNGFHDLLHRVEAPVQEIFKIASMEPGAILLMASQAYQAKSHKADEYIRMIETRIERAVGQCVSAAGALFQSSHQKELMRAARLGTAFMKEGPSSIFHQQCVTLKLLNAVRHYRIGLPLTLPQLTRLTTPVLLDRLIQRRLFPLALEVAQFLQLPPAEGKSRVLAHWAIYKVETSTSEETETARQVSSRLGLTPDISYSDIAEKAIECGKRQLAIQLLEHEVRADRQVPLLLKLEQGAQALRKAIFSGDTDLVYHVILSLKEKHSMADFHMIMRQDSIGSKLYTLYCQQPGQQSLLSDWLQQEDDFASMARASYADSFGTGRVEARLARLVAAQENFKKSKEEFNLSVCEESHKLIKYQGMLEEKLGKLYINLSLHQTLDQLLREREVKLADKLKSEFKLSERKYFWLKVRAFGESGQWAELNALAKTKKSPIGFAPFLDVCLKQGERAQAAKYLSLLGQEDRLRYALKLGALGEAAEAAFVLRDIDALSRVESLAGGDSHLLDKVAGFKARLHAGTR